MKLRPFELTLVVVFGTFFVLALILLRTYTAPPKENETIVGSVSIWGVLPAEGVDNILRQIKAVDKGFTNVTYRYIPAENFDSVFVNALADQKAPDAILLPHDRLVKHRSRLNSVSYQFYPLRDYRNNYVDGAEIFALSDGIYAFPLAVDPLLMYWNRAIFADAGLLVPPATWEEVVGNTVPTLTKRDFNRNILQATIAMGEYRNVKNAFPVLSLLLLQAGSSLVTEKENQYQIKLDQRVDQVSNERPLAKAVSFYTNFSNTANTLYTWNKAQRLDRDMFLSEDLALYFGYASEGKEIAARNPNLSFDIAEIPQGSAATVKRTYGLFYSLAVPKSARNKDGAFTAIQVLSSPTYAKAFADVYNLAPVHRTSLQQDSNDLYGRIAYRSAVYARGWLNPDLSQLGGVLTQMVDDINANRIDISKATSDALERIKQLY
jgi:ABC-type glycerol-3-phosphate transport system substrate-binding protein